MADELGGAFQIKKDIMYFQLPDGRRFSLSLGKDALTIHDISWIPYFTKEEGKSLTREAILSTEHSEIEHSDSSCAALFDFMDNAPVPFPGKREGQ